MSTESLTVNIPSLLYEQLKQQAEQSQRSVEEETLELLAAAVPAGRALPAELAEAIDCLESCDDAALWHAARSALTTDERERLEALHVIKQRGELSDAQTKQLAELVLRYERQMLVRAQAMALLKVRGDDVSELTES